MSKNEQPQDYEQLVTRFYKAVIDANVYQPTPAHRKAVWNEAHKIRREITDEEDKLTTKMNKLEAKIKELADHPGRPAAEQRWADMLWTYEFLFSMRKVGDVMLVWKE